MDIPREQAQISDFRLRVFIGMMSCTLGQETDKHLLSNLTPHPFRSADRSELSTGSHLSFTPKMLAQQIPVKAWIKLVSSRM
jgi:hypothetical protein